MKSTIPQEGKQQSNTSAEQPSNNTILKNKDVQGDIRMPRIQIEVPQTLNSIKT
jgi:hypothetical protein